MRIDEYGNVSIGTSDDSNYMLNVAGEANCVKLTTTSLQINTIPLSIIYQLDDILENGNVTTNVATFGKVSVSDPTVATTASNLVTWNSTTQEFEDSGGLISNKLSIVSEQPPSALSANTTSVANHGTYTLTTSGLATNSNTWNAFDDDTSVAWTSVDGYSGASNAYAGSVQLASTTGTGEWLAVEFPYKATLRHVKLTPSSVASYPTDANIYATNDSLTWDLLKSWTGVTPGSDTEEQTVIVNASDAYRKYAIVTTKVAGDSITASLAEWKLFCESFTVDGGKVKMATSAVTGGETVVEQTTAHARESAVLKKYPEVAMAEAYTDPNSPHTYVYSGHVITGSVFGANGREPYLAFNGEYGPSRWHGGYGTMGSTLGTSPDQYHNVIGGTQYIQDTDSTTHYGSWVTVRFPNKIKIKSASIRSTGNNFNSRRRAKGYKIFGSDDNSSFVQLGTRFDGSSSSEDVVSHDINATQAYQYITLLVDSIWYDGTNDPQQFYIQQIDYYGYEETNTTGDTSLDTTITCKYNTPDLTNASLYLDGLKGSTATDYSGNELSVTENEVMWDSTEKAWTLSGAATSNIVTGGLGLEGEQPHSVSAWVKADVLNDDGLLHLGTNEGEGCAMTRLGFVDGNHVSWGGDYEYFSNAEWHNVTYTYGAGEKALYIDGKLVGTAPNTNTFGEYPPKIVSSYVQNGYEFSASYENTGASRLAWKAFNNASSPNFWDGGEAYDRSAPYNATSTYSTTDVDGVNHYGSWVQMKTPGFNLCVSYLFFTNYGTYSSPGNRAPTKITVLGSHDDSNWHVVRANIVYDPVNNIFANIAGKKGYKYIRFVFGQLTGGDGAINLGLMRVFGHIENDIVRFPDPVNEIKFPHIPLIGSAQRGYEIEASSYYDGRTANRLFPYHAFTEKTNKRWQSRDATGVTRYNYNGSYGGTTSTTVDSASVSGEWIQLKLPRKITLTGFKMTELSGFSHRLPVSGILAASNDNSTWTSLDSWSSGYTTDTVRSVSTSTAYMYFRIIAQTIGVDAYNVALANVAFYGTEEDSDVIARIGDGYDGKVRNLRVYSTALSKDRV